MSRKSVTRRVLVQRIIVNGKVLWEKKEEEIITPAVKVELEFPSVEWGRFEDELDMLSDFLDVPYLYLDKPKGLVDKIKKVFKKSDKE